MSYDIFVQDLPDDAATFEDIPADFKPASIGRRSFIIARISKIVPTADFSDPSWGIIEGDSWSIEVSMGADEECRGFALHVRGGAGALEVVATILQSLNLRALDPQAGGFFARAASKSSFSQWCAYRDQVTSKNES